MDYKTQSDKQWSTKHKATSNGLQNTKRQAMVYKTQSDKQWTTKHKATSNGLQNTKRQAMVYKTQSDKQWTTKHKATSNGLQNTNYSEDNRSSNTIPTKNRSEMSCAGKGKKVQLH
jgi:hypothetical protein